MLKMSAETHHLVESSRRKAFYPLEVVATVLIATMVFVIVFFVMCFRQNIGLAGAVILGPMLFSIIGLGLIVHAYRRQKSQKAMRFWYALIPLWFLAIICGTYCGDVAYWAYTAQYEEYMNLATYTTVNPETEKAESFMDVGRMYFTNSAMVMSNFSISFVNGATYCIAPILLDPDSTNLNNVSLAVGPDGLSTPNCGSVDYWSVGEDCCTNTSWTCGDYSSSTQAGVRILGATVQEMYKLATQEWAATYEVDVLHPLFFTWSQEPLATVDSYRTGGYDELGLYAIYCVFVVLFLVVFMHLAMMKAGAA